MRSRVVYAFVLMLVLFLQREDASGQDWRSNGLAFSKSPKTVSAVQLASQAKAHFAESGPVALPISIGSAANWKELIDRTSPTYFDAIKIRSSPLLGKVPDSKFEAYTNSQNWHPSLPRWIILVRKNEEWHIPEVLFSEHLSHRIEAMPGDAFFSKSFLDLEYKSRTAVNHNADEQFVTLAMRLPFTEVLSVRSKALESTETNTLFEKALGSEAGDYMPARMYSALRSNQVEILVISNQNQNRPGTIRFVVPVPMVPVYGFSRQEAYWRKLYSLQLIHHDEILLTHTKLLPIVVEHSIGHAMLAKPDSTPHARNCFLKLRER